jgi:hypothetical protein
LYPGAKQTSNPRRIISRRWLSGRRKPVPRWTGDSIAAGTMG